MELWRKWFSLYWPSLTSHVKIISDLSNREGSQKGSITSGPSHCSNREIITNYNSYSLPYTSHSQVTSIKPMLFYLWWKGSVKKSFLNSTFNQAKIKGIGF